MVLDWYLPVRPTKMDWCICAPSQGLEGGAAISLER